MQNPKEMKRQTNLWNATSFEAIGGDGEASRVPYRCFAHSFDVNTRAYQFRRAALQELADGYVEKTLLLNHLKRPIGWGQTEVGEVLDEGLYINFYVLRGQTFPAGPLGGSDEVITALDDGCLQYVSMGFDIKASVCSICGNDFNMWMGCGEHYRGETYPVKEEGRLVEKLCVEIIESCEAIELSLVYLGAEREAKVVTRLERLEGLYDDGVIDRSVVDGYYETHLLNEPKPKPVKPDVKELDMATIESLQNEVKLLETEVRALKAEKRSETDQVTHLTKQNQDLRDDAQKYEVYKSEAAMARERALDELGVEFVASKEGVTDEERDARIALVKPLPLGEIYQHVGAYRALAKERFQAQRDSQPEGDEDKDKEKTSKTGLEKPLAVEQTF